MVKLKMASENLVERNIDKIAELFPNCLTEMVENGEGKRKIDFDLLRQELSSVLVEGKDERYRLDWSGKRQAILTANSPIAKTLRPVKNDEDKPSGADSLGQPYASSGSVGKNGKKGGFDSENLYIEGDNLDVLKLLHETYLGKIKMIYIDPPYNTGNDFVYRDDFAEDAEEYLVNSNQQDAEGNKLTTNKDTSGRYHSDWLSMMYMRLKIARDLLSDDGAIFISIDDNEQTNTIKLCNEIFGESNKVAEFVVIRSEGGGMAKQVVKGHDYLFVYAKYMSTFSPLGKPKDIRGKIVERNGEKYWIQEDWLRKEFGKYGNCHYEEVLECKGLEKLKEIDEGLKKGEYVLIPKSNGMNVIGKLRNIKEDSSKFYSILKHLSANGIKDLKDLNLDKYFSYPKPVSLIKEMVAGNTIFTSQKKDIILDFFSGSATTAHAVMQLNAEDNGNRKFIMVQVPEVTDDNSEAAKAGYKNICEIGKERIRRSGAKIAEENRLLRPDLDIGFRVLKLDDSNMQDVYYNPNELKQADLFGLQSSIKEDRTAEDVLFQIMLDKGVLLSSKIVKRTTQNGKQSYYVVGKSDHNIIDLICCLDNNIDTEAVKEIAKLKPECCVFLDSSMANDSTRTNIEQIFITHSPSTKVEVI